jgi:aspartyl protease family protein
VVLIFNPGVPSRRLMRLGETRVTVRLQGPAGETELEMLVDTGATITTVPEAVARLLGIQVDEVVDVKLADGTVRQFGMGEAKLELRGLKKTVGLLIVPGGVEPLLGLTALELLRLKVNPVTRELEPAGYKLYSFISGDCGEIPIQPITGT